MTLSDRDRQSLGERLRWLATHAGNAGAVRDRRELLTYGDLPLELDRLNRALGASGLGRVLVILPDNIASYVLHVYCLVNDATIIPQSPMLPAHRLADLLALVRPDTLVTSRSILQKYRSVDFGCPVLLAPEGSDSRGSQWAYDHRPSHGDASRQPEVRVLLFTSGSTGAPKGVCLGEQSIMAAAAMNVEILSLSPSRRSLITVPLFDYYGLIQVHSHILAGAEVVLGESVAFAASLVDQAERAEVTDLVGVPYGLRRIFASLDDGGSRLAGLQMVTSSSDTLVSDVQSLIFSACPGVEIVDVYGLVEAGRACSRRLGEPETGEFVGRPAPGVTITGGAPQRPEGLVIRGPNVMLGYMTEVAVDGTISYEPASCVGSGDIGYVDASDNVHILGRRNDLLNVRGAKIHPSEIESVAHEVAGIADARARLLSGPEPEIVLDVETDDRADLGELRRMLKERLPSQFVPKTINRVLSIDRTSLGSKVIRS
jgi:long-chain acyl-CoA synthetase